MSKISEFEEQEIINEDLQIAEIEKLTDPEEIEAAKQLILEDIEAEEKGESKKETSPETKSPEELAKEKETLKEGEKQPAEKPPTEGKSSQEPPSPDDSKEPAEPEKGKDVPYGQWRDTKTRLDNTRAQLTKASALLDELGVKTKEDAEFLLKDVETAKAEGLEAGKEEGRVGLVKWIVNNTQAFREDLHKNHPEKFAEIVQNDVYSFANAIAGTNKELAEQIVEAAREYFGNGQSNGRRAPESSEQSKASQELTAIQEEKQEVFDEQAASEINTVFHSKIAELTKGIAFHSEKQRERFNNTILQGVSLALDKNPIFTRQYERLGDVRGLSRAELKERRKDVVALHLRHATDSNLLSKLIEEEKEAMGLKLQQKKPDGEVRTEVTGSGAPIGGKLTQDAKDKKYGELQEKYDGRMLSAKYAEWLHSQGARP